MKYLLEKIVVITFLICISLFSSIVFADGAPDYNKNLYTVVVNKTDGGNLYDLSNIQKFIKVVPYGTKLVVEGEYEKDGMTFLIVGDYYLGEYFISSFDVEIYGEPITPVDLRTC